MSPLLQCPIHVDGQFVTHKSGPPVTQKSGPHPFARSCFNLIDAMWSRLAEGLAEIVAPEEGYAQELTDASDQDSIHVDSVETRPQFGPVSGSEPSVAGDKLREDEDEQEDYIRDLERALLQQKKQNNVLENKVNTQARWSLVIG